MINLLPPDIKNGYRYARSNVLLRQWVTIFIVALVGLGAIATFGLLSIHQSSRSYEKQIAVSDALFQKENYTAVQKRVEDISGSFKLVVNVLGQEILFSQLIKQIAATIPPKANLTGLNINQAQSAIDITANAVDYNTATQVQVNLADPTNKIFSKADIVNISCISKTDAVPTSSGYPCTVNIRALFSNNNTYLFINSKGAKVKP
jgi:hypothetical protein